MEFNWQIVFGTIIGLCGAAFGSVGGVGGGSIFVPMLTLVIGFDPKPATAISKCTSTKAFLRGVETWKIQTILKQEAAKRQEQNGNWRRGSGIQASSWWAQQAENNFVFICVVTDFHVLGAELYNYLFDSILGGELIADSSFCRSISV